MRDSNIRGTAKKIGGYTRSKLPQCEVQSGATSRTEVEIQETEPRVRAACLKLVDKQFVSGTVIMRDKGYRFLRRVSYVL